MTDIIKELFSSHIYEHYNESEEVKALTKKGIDLWQELIPIIGLERVDEITDTQGQIDRETYLEWFRRGIQLGAAVMLEVLK